MNPTRSPLLADSLPQWRSRLVLGVLLTGFLALSIRSYYLQGIHKDFLIGKGESRYERVIEMPATRGRILDRNGDVLAVSTPVKSIWAIPEDAKLTPAQTRTLAGLLDSDPRDLARKLAVERDFVFLKRQIAPDVANKVAELKLPGIHFQNEYRRYYPVGEVASHMLGFTGAEEKGLEGIELALEEQLAGKSGSRRVIKDRRGQIVEDVESIHPPQEGKDTYLALDAKLQYLAHSQLKRAIAEHKAKAGGIVMIDAKSGEILALVNMPTYNPNNREKLSGQQLRNRAFTDTFEPGSTFKPFGDRYGARKVKHRTGNHLGYQAPRRAFGCPDHSEIIQCRRRQNGIESTGGRHVGDVRQARLRPTLEARLPRRGRRSPATLEALAAD